ncbi:glycosyltransferase [Aeromonas veronii]|uniref:glycosyltransferase n=1 Tax=Aeromonas veronii TaxID=654 RepID=UPI00286081BD|nr:glycosyltransferase [Aeromonas veronii]ELC7279248.1 glycosyltransferase [Aeromonas veronii]HDX8361527.1 glycosyltransferase [Aeromonas veronii]
MSNDIQPSNSDVLISVCMATYNGERFIKQQICSILEQLGDNDELIIVDDCSKDSTVSIIESVSDSRIKLNLNSINKGVNRTFEKAISLSSGKYIFLSDQDDIWVENRVKLMLGALNDSKELLVSTNFTLIDVEGAMTALQQPYQLTSSSSTTYIRNILNIFLGRISYYGCAMAFKRELVQYILPMPKVIESHDLWIAIVANCLGSNLHMENSLLLHRIHGSNASVVSRDFSEKVLSRVIFLINCFNIVSRVVFTSMRGLK